MVGNYHSANINCGSTYSIVSVDTDTFYSKGDIS